MGRVVGIDLGTTFSAVAAMSADGRAEIVHNRDGRNTTPSVVLFDGDDILVGEAAKNQIASSSGDIVSYVKRHMGSRDYVFMPDSSDGSYGPEHISAFILKYLVDGASEALGEPVTDALITVPAYFDEGQRNATKQAGVIAGLNVLGVLNEPTAAAVSYGIDTGFEGTVLVYDLGGGTFDVTVMKSGRGVVDIVSTEGDRNLGGFDFDNVLIELVLREFVGRGGQPITDTAILAGLRERVEAAKLRLSTSASAPVFVSSDGMTEKIVITREQFESATIDLMLRTEYILENVVEAAGLRFADIDKVLLVGGSTRMPMVRSLVARVTGREPDTTVHPDEAVALGAAIAAEVRTAHSQNREAELAEGKTVRISDVVSHGLGVAIQSSAGTMVNYLLIKPNTTIPCQIAVDDFGTVADGQSELNVQITESDEDGCDLRHTNILGTSLLKLSQPRPAGSPIRVVFSCDIDGVLHVEVTDLADNSYVGEMEILRTATLSDAEVSDLTRETASAAVQ